MVSVVAVKVVDPPKVVGLTVEDTVVVVSREAATPVPERAIVLLVADVLEQVTVAERAPRIDGVNLTLRVPDTEPLDCVNVALVPKVVPSLETAKSVVGETLQVTFARRFAPVTLDVIAVEDVKTVWLPNASED